MELYTLHPSLSLFFFFLSSTQQTAFSSHKQFCNEGYYTTVLSSLIFFFFLNVWSALRFTGSYVQMTNFVYQSSGYKDFRFQPTWEEHSGRAKWIHGSTKTMNMLFFYEYTIILNFKIIWKQLSFRYSQRQLCRFQERSLNASLKCSIQSKIFAK